MQNFVLISQPLIKKALQNCSAFFLLLNQLFTSGHRLNAFPSCASFSSKGAAFHASP